jgi:AmiR/NasT family two-component response regulator
MWLAVLTSFVGQRRHLQWKNQVARLQRRLSDRIVIERAKGILVQRLKISEEEAYKRLRVLSRRQRRQIRDIAQSLLDTQFLFLPETDGIAPFTTDKLTEESENQTAPG